MRWLGKNLIPFSIIFTKADKLKEVEINEHILKYLNDIRKDWDEIPQHFITSSEKKIGKSELLNYIDEVNKSISSI